MLAPLIYCADGLDRSRSLQMDIPVMFGWWVIQPAWSKTVCIARQCLLTIQGICLFEDSICQLLVRTEVMCVCRKPLCMIGRCSRLRSLHRRWVLSLASGSSFLFPLPLRHGVKTQKLLLESLLLFSVCETENRENECA